MNSNIKKFLYETKSKIGLVHVFTACIGAVLLSYLTTMLLSTLIVGNYSLKIVPAMILTPILMSLYGTWILFSKTRIIAIKKTLYTSIFLLCSLYISIEVF